MPCVHATIVHWCCPLLFAGWSSFWRLSLLKVAIKKIPSAFDDVVDAKRIVREVRLLRRLDHMNIIKIVDILPPPSLADFNDVYIVSELMDTDLHRVIYSSQVSSAQVAKMR